MWQFPWGYKESFAFVGGVVFIGFILQLSFGAFDFTLLQYPANISLGGIIILFLLLFSLKRKSRLYQWFSGVSLAVTLIGALVVLGVIMGLTKQVDQDATVNDLPFRVGFTHITSAWYFVLVYFITLLSLGALIVRRIIPFQLKDYAFYLNHIGLWVLLFSAGMGASDLRKYIMYVEKGEIEWRVYNDKKNKMLELPIAIKLNEFRMEEYPPKLTLIDRKTGMSQPEKKPEYFQIDTKQPEGKLNGWDISLKEYIQDAVHSSDTTYREVPMPGSSPAAKIEISNPQTGVRKSGWVCAGNLAQPYMVVNVDTLYCVAMTRAEPKRFVSNIDIFMEDGRRGHTLLEVNKPYKIGNWMIYQYGYDNEAGNMSTYSSFELVYDPWVIPVYIGFILLACGSVCLLWSGNKRKEVNDDVE